MSESDMSANGEIVAREWLTWLYGEKPDGLIWIGGHANGFRGTLHETPAGAARAAYMLDLAGTGRPWGVYHRLTTVRADLTTGRGAVEDSICLPALMMDLDLRGPGHKSDRYPETAEQLADLLREAGLPEPTTWVESGGGRYAVWRLAEPADLRDADTRAALAGQSLALQRGVIEVAKAHDWKIDNTSDLARIFRVPGTTNRKAGPGGEVMATWHPERAGTGRYFDLGELRVARSSMSASVAPASPPALDETAWGSGGMAALFAGAGPGAASGIASGGRAFTVTDAMAFVRSSLDALATATDGEINVRLNEAACMLAHFGPEFWDQEAADRQLWAALACTMYDGVTWKAEDTIASARRAMAGSWRAHLIPTPAAALEQALAGAEGAVGAVDGIDPVEALLAEMLEPDEIISRPPPRYLIHSVLQFDSESWLIGPPGSRKSFVVLDMAARIVRGESWQGHATHAADVVMIVAEGAGGVGKRMAAWKKRYGAFPAGSLRILPRPVQASDFASWAVLVAACRRLAESARARDRGLLVVLDTQARVTVGLKENDATDMGVFVQAISAIRAASGACVLSVHHTGRNGGDARGSSAIDGAQTTELKVTSKGKLTGRLSVEKQKDIEEIDPIDLAFEVIVVGQDDEGRDVTSLVVAEQDSAAFRAAWAGSEVTAEGVEAQEQAKITPFKSRTNLDWWIVQREPRASLQHWIVQALVDTAQTLGLTQTEIKDIIEEKRGSVDKTTFKRAWQKVTEDGGPWSDVVTASGGQRWTVDRLAIKGLKHE